MNPRLPCLFFFFFNDTATTEIYTLSLHDALPISAAIAGDDWMSLWLAPSVPKLHCLTPSGPTAKTSRRVDLKYARPSSPMAGDDLISPELTWNEITGRPGGTV